MNYYPDSLFNSLLLIDAQQVPSEQFTQSFVEQIQIETDLGLEPYFDIPQLSPYAPLEF